MITREEQKDPKKRILSACVTMFIEKGFHKTTMLEILKEADVSAGTFQNLFKTKDGVLYALAEFMFVGQFDMARKLSESVPDPVAVYATETAIQLALAEQSENLREIYVEAYTNPALAEFLYQKTSTELYRIFGTFQPAWTESDFYEADVGTSGMMRAYMARPCDKYFTLKRKTEKFLRAALAVYRVPEERAFAAISHVNALDTPQIAERVMGKLFTALEMQFDCKFNRRGM